MACPSTSATARSSAWSARAARARACSAARWCGCCRRARLQDQRRLGAARRARPDDGRRGRDAAQVRGGEIGMIFQNPTSHLDPVMRIGDQIAEGIRYHQRLAAKAARAAAIEMLGQVGFPDPARQYDGYPHEFSGGMRQRAMIAVALSCNPEDPDRRRADDGARRDDPGADPAAADGPARPARPVDHPDHPRPRHRRPDLRPHRGAARRPDRGGGPKRDRCWPRRAHPYTVGR